MNGKWQFGCAAMMALIVCVGCQIYKSTSEIRSDEQMLDISFENDAAQDLFMKAVNTTYGNAKTIKSVGIPGLSVYSRNESVAWNANCNDHIRQMDVDGNLIITEYEARSYYDSIMASVKNQ